MVQIISSILFVIMNMCFYLAFGSLILNKKGKKLSLGLSLIMGFFAYYFIFFIVCMPVMIKYRPLRMLTNIWIPIVFIITIISIIISRKKLIEAFISLFNKIKNNKLATVFVAIIILIQVILVTTTYNFTLDAAYYVANVSTSLQTNMINVYDPFTGAWQNHYEIRYFFATYSINDAVMCQFFNANALIWTKIVMSATVIILANVLYIMFAEYLFEDDIKSQVIMLVTVLFVNMTFFTIFTQSNFLLTRTYEGKTIVGNLALPFLFYIYIKYIDDKGIDLPWLMGFLVSVGSITISSSANMLIPAELCLLYVPYMIINRKIKFLPKFLLCIIPGIIMALVYVLYIKGFFVLYTYPTHVS